MEEPESPSEMSLLDLPDEMLEKIVELLDSSSMVALAMTSATLRERFAHMCTELKTQSITNLIMDYAACNSTNIHSLDLNNCRAKPSAIENLILRCRNVKELKVVNCGLMLPQLLNVLRSLEFIESIALCFFDIPEDNRSFFVTHPTIKKIYMEAAPPKTFSAILDFLNTFVNVEFIHVAFIGRELSRNNYKSRTFRINEELWKTLHTILFSCHQSSCFFRRELGDMLIEICAASHSNKFWVRECMEFFEYELEDGISDNVTEMVACKDISNLDDAYGFCVKPRSEKVRPTPFCLTRPIPKHMVELDLTGCHGPFPAKSWDNLVENAPNLEGLAIPVCSLPPALDSLADVTESRATPEHKLRARMHAADCCVVNALKKIKLKRLHCTGVLPTLSSRGSCAQCRISWMSYTIGELEMLPCLEELTLTKIKTPHLIFENLVNSRMKAARLSFVKIGNIRDLKTFMQRCTNLEFFKIGAVDLPLEQPVLWEALAAGTKLKQICISPESLSNAFIIHGDMVREYLPKLLRTVEIFHWHNSSIGHSFSKLIQELIAAENSMRTTNKIHYLQPPCPTLSNIEYVNLIQAVPGRAICCSTNFIGKIPMEGWNHE